MCPLCTHVSKSGRVLKTHTIHDNSHNKAGRQLQFISEVTLIGTHIVSKFQPNPTIIATVMDHFGTQAASFKTISFQDHCVANCIEINSYKDFFQDHLDLVYFQHNGRTAHIPTTPHSTGPLRTSRQHFRSGRVMSPSRWKCPIFPKTDGMPASLVSWALKASSDGSILRFPKMMNSRKSWITYSKPSLTLLKYRCPTGITSMKCTVTSNRVSKKPLIS